MSTTNHVLINKALLEEISENLREKIYEQHNLLLLAKEKHGDAEIMCTLTSTIYRTNNDLYNLYQRVNDLANSEGV